MTIFNPLTWISNFLGSFIGNDYEYAKNKLENSAVSKSFLYYLALRWYSYSKVFRNTIGFSLAVSSLIVGSMFASFFVAASLFFSSMILIQFISYEEKEIHLALNEIAINERLDNCIEAEEAELDRGKKSDKQHLEWELNHDLEKPSSWVVDGQPSTSKILKKAIKKAGKGKKTDVLAKVSASIIDESVATIKKEKGSEALTDTFVASLESQVLDSKKVAKASIDGINKFSKDIKKTASSAKKEIKKSDKSTKMFESHIASQVSNGIATVKETEAEIQELEACIGTTLTNIKKSSKESESETQTFKEEMDFSVLEAKKLGLETQADTDNFIKDANKVVKSSMDLESRIKAESASSEAGIIGSPSSTEGFNGENTGEYSISDLTSTTTMFSSVKTSDYIDALKKKTDAFESDDDRQKRLKQEELEFNQMMSSFGA